MKHQVDFLAPGWANGCPWRKADLPVKSSGWWASSPLGDAVDSCWLRCEMCSNGKNLESWSKWQFQKSGVHQKLEVWWKWFYRLWNRDMTAAWDVLKQQRWIKKHEEPFQKRSHRWHLKHLLESNAITVVSLTLGTPNVIRSAGKFSGWHGYGTSTSVVDLPYLHDWVAILISVRLVSICFSSPKWRKRKPTGNLYSRTVHFPINFK